MSHPANSSSRPHFSRAFWFILAIVALGGVVLGLLLRSGSHHIKRERRIDLETAEVRSALRDYQAAFGAFPKGDNRDILDALMRKNARQIVFLHPRPEAVSAEGRLLDPWGTPYKFYFSGKEVLVRSAGPNKQFDDSEEKNFDDYIR